MYRVVEMHGDNEPWWFFEDWQDDIVAKHEFETFYEALSFYKEEWQRLSQEFSDFKSQADFMSAFWTKSETRWCLECDEFLQQYHGLALLEDWHMVESFPKRMPYDRRSGAAPHNHCSLKRLEF
ncbi:DUF1033 family protein [Lactococcus insecticola]|uniref:Uncharacterized protein n=1 Tax=Pseudolactococcus insecticola TaxID=2709158 RepID=A0A6A0B8C4_9LACT|nr:DUF1033 family protein [Lactococcus insecticola]GFH40913.1 hypothetical protein Hs20B_13110 [Lactococcus insecticola]